MSACFLFDFLNFFSPVYAVVKQTPVLVFHTTQSTCKKICDKCLSQEYNIFRILQMLKPLFETTAKESAAIVQEAAADSQNMMKSTSNCLKIYLAFELDLSGKYCLEQFVRIKYFYQ